MKNTILLVIACLLIITGFSQELARPSAIKEISHSLDPMGWVLLFLGWIMYWFKKMDETRKAKPEGWFAFFVSDNTLEIPISALSCLVLAILADEIPTDLIDMKGKLSIFFIGFGASSFLNGMLTKAKSFK